MRLAGSVTIPKRPSSVGGLLSWARGVNKAIQELRDRKIVGVVAKSTGDTRAAPLPLTIKQGTAADKFQIVPGYVNDEMPTLSATALDDDPPPEITVDQTKYVWAKCVGTFGSPDTYVVTVETSATATTPAGTAITATGFVSFFYIGRVEFTSGTPDTFEIFNQYDGGNLGVDSFGNINLWFKR